MIIGKKNRISICQLVIFQRPKSFYQLDYLGLLPFDSNNLAKLAQDFNGKTFEIKEIANLLYNGAIIAVIRDRQECK